MVQPGSAATQLVEESRLSQSRLAEDLDDRASTTPSRLGGREQGLELGLAADELVGSGLIDRIRGRNRTDADCLDRVLLSLHVEGLDPGCLEPRRGTGDDVARREELTGRCLRHQARREVHRVAHDGVRPPIRGADVTGEHRAAVHADADRQLEWRVEHLSERQEEAPLIVTGARRRARRQDDLAAVVVHVRAEERDVAVVRRGLDHGHQAIEPRCRGFGPVGRDHCVRAVVVDEGDGYEPVLRLVVLGQQMCAQSDRDAGRDVSGPRSIHAPGRRRDSRRAPQEVPGPLRRTEQRRPQCLRGPFAHDDLSSVGHRFQRHHCGGARPSDDQLPVRATDQEHVEDAGLDADRHPQREPHARHLQPAGGPQGASHPHCS